MVDRDEIEQVIAEMRRYANDEALDDYDALITRVLAWAGKIEAVLRRSSAVPREALDVAHRIMHEFTGKPCRDDGGWCDARDHAEAIVRAVSGEAAETRAVLTERNMYGCLPCPKCGSKFRWPTQDRTIQCDDCGLVEALSPDTDTATPPHRHRENKQ